MTDHPYLSRRKGVWQYYRRVPIEYVEYDKREAVKQSTKVKIADDPKATKALRVVDEINRVVEAYWKGLVDGQALEAERRYAEARRRARALGLDYLPAASIAELPSSDILERLERLRTMGVSRDIPMVEAALGAERPPVIMLSALFERFEVQVRTELKDMSPDQVRKWRNPKIRAMKNLIKVIDDKPIQNITANDALDFSEWWQARVIDEDMDPDTANKDMGHITRMLFVLNKRFRLGMLPVFTGMRLEGSQENTRPPYDVEYLRKRVLAPDALMGLNDEARRVIFLMADSGVRPSEAVNLNQSTIVLDADIPHLQIRPDGRRLKTQQSKRDIPLVGCALAAMKEQPRGFPRYHDSSSELSAAVNKFLRENGLRQETGDRTLYSLRHTFKDRLVNARAEDSMIDSRWATRRRAPNTARDPTLS